MPTDSPMPSPDINAPSPSTSSVSVEDLSVQNTSFDISNTDKYSISSMENSNNNTDVYVPTTVVSNIKSYITPDSFNTVQGMFNLSLLDKASLNCFNNKLLFRII